MKKRPRILLRALNSFVPCLPAALSAPPCLVRCLCSLSALSLPPVLSSAASPVTSYLTLPAGSPSPANRPWPLQQSSYIALASNCRVKISRAHHCQERQRADIAHLVSSLSALGSWLPCRSSSQPIDRPLKLAAHPHRPPSQTPPAVPLSQRPRSRRPYCSLPPAPPCTTAPLFPPCLRVLLRAA